MHREELFLAIYLYNVYEYDLHYFLIPFLLKKNHDHPDLNVPDSFLVIAFMLNFHYHYCFLDSFFKMSISSH